MSRGDSQAQDPQAKQRDRHALWTRMWFQLVPLVGSPPPAPTPAAPLHARNGKAQRRLEDASLSLPMRATAELRVGVAAAEDPQFKVAPLEGAGSGARGRPGRPPRVEGCSVPRLVVFLVFVGGVVGAFLTLDEDSVGDILEWMNSASLQGAALFMVVYAIAIVLLVPGTLLSLCAGAMFKWRMGTALVWVGQSVGQTLAFLMGRYLLRELVVANILGRYRKFAAVDAALEREGWRLVALMRLSPIVPWNVLNYLLSITGVGLVEYAAASALAVLPWLSLFVYIGSMAASLADVLNGRVVPDSGTQLAVVLVSGLLLVAAVLYTGVVARRAISDAFRAGDGDALDPDSVQEEGGLLQGDGHDTPQPLEDSVGRAGGASFREWLGGGGGGGAGGNGSKGEDAL